MESKLGVLNKVLDIRVGFPFPIASAAITATFFGKFTKSNWVFESKLRALDKFRVDIIGY